MLITIVLTSTFVIPPLTPPCLQRRRASDCSLRVDDVPDGATDAVTESRDSLKAALERDALKGRLLRVCAACNRGFGASALDRASVDSLLDRLCRVDPCEEPTAGVTGSDAAERWVGRGLESAGWSDGTVANGPLDGVWRLVYTNATDVLSLDVNPVAGVGPISQEISLPDRVVNVIEFYPRALSLLPAGALPTTTRVRVGTRARARSPSRVGLTFETVGVEAREGPLSTGGGVVVPHFPDLSRRRASCSASTCRGCCLSSLSRCLACRGAMRQGPTRTPPPPSSTFASSTASCS
jgi:hypothetical protein